jgi:ElaB/YqjD/DUF883 family membrane-anchored ribosome-binding protein
MTDRQVRDQETEHTPGGEAGRPASAGEDASQQSDQERLRYEIEETRAELGDTVDALSQKADVKSWISEKVEDRKAAWRERQEDVKSKMSGAGERVVGAPSDAARRAASRVTRTAEERPHPAIAVALGLGLLIGWTFGRR